MFLFSFLRGELISVCSCLIFGFSKLLVDLSQDTLLSFDRHIRLWWSGVYLSKLLYMSLLLFDYLFARSNLVHLLCYWWIIVRSVQNTLQFRYPRLQLFHFELLDSYFLTHFAVWRWWLSFSLLIPLGEIWELVFQWYDDFFNLYDDLIIILYKFVDLSFIHRWPTHY